MISKRNEVEKYMFLHGNYCQQAINGRQSKVREGERERESARVREKILFAVKQRFVCELQNFTFDRYKTADSLCR